MSDADGFVPFDAEVLLADADWARGLASRLVRDASEADDLVQDAMAAAIRRPPSTDRPLRPWFAGVMRKLALARRRGEGRRARREALVGTEVARANVPSAAEVVSRLDSHRVLSGEVAALSEPFRSAIYLRYYEGLDSGEIGRRLGVPAATVRWRLARGIAELRARLDARSKGGRAEWLAALAPLAAGSRMQAPSIPTDTAASGLPTGVLAMSTALKVLCGAAAVIALLTLLWTNDGDATRPVNAGGAGESAVVPGTVPSRTQKHDQRPRVERRGEADSDAATVAPGAADPIAAEPAPAAQPGGPRIQVRARLLDATGAPAVAARVVPWTGKPIPGADAGADGRVEFSMEDVATPRLQFIVSAKDCATRVVAPPLQTANGVVDLGDVRLGPGGTVSGRVLEGETPIAGIQVSVMFEDDEKSRGSGHPLCEGDALGNFTLHGVPVGARRISLGKTGFESASASVEVRAAAESSVGIVRMERADPAARASGVVLAPDGKSAADVTVFYRFEGQEGSATGSTRSDGEGRFEVRGGRGKTWRMSARDPDGRSSPAMETLSGDNAIVLRLSDPQWAELVVTRDGGAPVERFDVWIRSPYDGAAERIEEKDYAGGVARIALPAQPFEVAVTAPGFATSKIGPLDPAKTGARIDVRVSPLPGLKGRVTAGGSPVAGALVTLRKVVRPGMREIRNGFPCLTTPASEAGVETDADGRFDLTLQREGRFVLRAEADDLAPAEAGPFDVTPSVGKSGIEISLTRGGGIEGRVIPATGQSADGVIVGISRGDGEAQTVLTGADGVFRFEHLTPGLWLVRRTERELLPGAATLMMIGMGEARFQWSCTVSDGAVAHFDVDLRDETKTAAQGVLRVDGAPAAGWRLALLDGPRLLTSETAASAAVGESGAFRVVAPRPESYVLRATSPRGVEVFFPLLDLNTTPPTLALDLVTGTVHVRGAPVGAPLALFWEDAAGRCAIGQAEIDAKGACGPVQMPAGRIRLVRAYGGEMDPRKWPPVAEGTLDAGGSVTIEVAAK